MTITEKIKKSVTTATGLPVFYQSAEQLNRICDYTEYPCAYFFLLQTQGISTENMTPREQVRVGVFFVNTTEFDFEAEQNEAIIQGCKENAFKWIATLPRDKYFRLVSIGQSERVYDQFDAQLTGYCVNVVLEEIDGYCNG